MIASPLNAAKFALALALGLPADLALAETTWATRCENSFSCSVEITQCDLRIIVFDRPTTQGSWVGIMGVPQGWEKVIVRIEKGSESESRTIDAPQLPRMAFGTVSLRDLMLAGQSAEIEILLGNRIAKSCRVSLEGLARTYRTLRERLR